MKFARIALALLSSLFIYSVAPAQTEIVPGKVIDGVAVSGAKDQSFSVYLPSNYDSKKKFPILYAFDPGGRGKVAVNAFAEAAEKYGYIVVGSNDSRNGLDGSRLTPILRNLWEDTHTRFPIGEGRVIMAGFSGGARVASSMAYSCGCAFGVIGSGAAFSQTVKVDEKLPFVFFGTAGYDDFNFQELRELDGRLSAAKVPFHINYFDGSHQWLTKPLADQALAWMELRAMKAGRRPKDDAFIEGMFAERLRNAEAQLAGRNFIEAASAFRGLVDDQTGLRDTSAAAAKLAALLRSDDLKKALRSEAEQFDEQQKKSAQLFGLAQMLERQESRADILNQLSTVVDGLRSRSEGANDSPSRRVTRRILGGAYVGAIEGVSAILESGPKYENALYLLSLADLMRPQDIQVSYLRAVAYAVLNDRKKAIESLDKAVKQGFKDADRVARDKRFDKLRGDEQFNKILASMKP